MSLLVEPSYDKITVANVMITTFATNHSSPLKLITLLPDGHKFHTVPLVSAQRLLRLPELIGQSRNHSEAEIYILVEMRDLSTAINENYTEK